MHKVTINTDGKTAAKLLKTLKFKTLRALKIGKNVKLTATSEDFEDVKPLIETTIKSWTKHKNLPTND